MRKNSAAVILAFLLFCLLAVFQFPHSGSAQNDKRLQDVAATKREGKSSKTKSRKTTSKENVIPNLVDSSVPKRSALTEIQGEAGEEQNDPDLPSKTFLTNRIDKKEYFQLRDEHVARLRGIEPGQPVNPMLRAQAIVQMEQQEAALGGGTKAAATVHALAFPNWTELGPRPVTNGQTQQFPATAAVTGRATAVVVDPTNSNNVYLGTAQGGVWRSTNGGTTWDPIFESAQSLAVGALAIAPSSPTTLYVGTGE